MLSAMLTKAMYYTTDLTSSEISDIKEKLTENPDKVYFPNLGSGDNIFTSGISLDRVMFKIPGTDFCIYWYGFFIALGILLAMMYGFKRMKPMGIDPDRATDAIIAGFIGALLGARAYYIAFNDEITFKEFFNYRDGGLAIYGGIIGAILFGGIVVKIRKMKLTAMLDVAAPCFLIGQCIGRWGNFVNQEAFGSNTDLPWGMISYSTYKFIADNYDELGGTVSSYEPVHPCFLYESLWCLICFIILHFYSKHRKFDGELFLMYIGLYGFGRFFIEGTRTDSLYIANIKVSQLVAGTCVFTALILIIIFRSMAKRSDYKFFYQTELSKRQLSALDDYEAHEKAKSELKKKIAAAKKSGESFAELEKEYDEKFGKTAKENAKKDADRIAGEKKELKAKIKEAKKSGKKEEAKKLKREYAIKYGGLIEEIEEDTASDYVPILVDDDEEETESEAETNGEASTKSAEDTAAAESDTEEKAESADNGKDEN